jgi:hypothetical protein
VDVVHSFKEAAWIIAEGSEAGVAIRAQDPSDLAREMIVVDLQSAR